jgi:CheY-like chemotaxis protein
MAEHDVLSFPIGTSQTVLIVDDDPAQRHEIATCLGDLGIETAQADDGAIAVEMVRALKPAVVIMDIRMPRMNGVDAVHVIGSDVGTKIILVSGDPESLYKANTSKLDVFTIMEKPIPLRSLSRFVLKALGRDVA